VTNRITTNTTPYQLPAGDSRVVINPMNGVIHLPASQPMGTMVTCCDTGTNPTTKTLDVAPGSGEIILTTSGSASTPHTIAMGGAVAVMKTSGIHWVIVASN